MAVRRAALLFALSGACSSSLGGGAPPDGAAPRDAAAPSVDAPPPADAPAPSVDAPPPADAPAPPTSDAGLHAVAFPHQSIRDVDVLFVVDDAPGMAAAQGRLRAALPAFTDALAALPAGWPNLHVAVISSDLGAGGWDVPGCTDGGDRGAFWSVPRGACTSTGLPAGQGFFSVGGGQTTFADGQSLADALACVVVQDDAGCRFPHPFASVLRALGADGQPPPPENAGFLRPGAFLSIVLVTNQDDCSAPPDSVVFDPSSMYVADALGPLTSFRCAERGLTCGGAPPSRTMAGPLTGCQSAEDGVLLRVSDAVARLQALKTDPNMVLVAALSGPPDPLAVELDPPGLPNDPRPWPALAASCTSGDGAVAARPGVRIEQWVYAFGHNGVLAKVCDDFATSLRGIADSIASVLGPPCLTGAFATTPGPHGARPDCTIVDYPAGGGDAGAGVPLPSCVDTAGAPPCWTLTDAAACPGGKLLGFASPPGAPPIGRNSAVSCLTCDDPTDPRCP
jgi:hypothetical protein